MQTSNYTAPIWTKIKVPSYIVVWILVTNQLTPWRQNPKVHHRIHNSPPTMPLLSQVNPLHSPSANLPKVRFHPILPSTPWPFKGSLSPGFSHQTPVHINSLCYACHMPRPSRSPSLYLLNNIWWWVQTMKLPTVQLSPLSRYLDPPESKYSPQHPVLKHPGSLYQM
jgi:hypothetical protein